MKLDQGNPSYRLDCKMIAGTHLLIARRVSAGTITSKTYGVAEKANVIVVKVLRSDRSGIVSDVIAGVGWAVKVSGDNAAAEIVEFLAGPLRVLYNY